MKKTALLFVNFILLLNNTFGQSQSELLSGYVNGSLNVLKVSYDWQSRGGYSSKTEKVTKQWPLSIERDANKNIAKITIMRAGIIEEVFTPDIQSYSTYFTNGVDRLTYINGNFFYYQTKQSTYDISDQIKYVLYQDEKSLSQLPEKYSDWIGLMNYFDEAKKGQSTAKQNLKADIEKQKEAEALKNSIKGKKIVKLDIDWLTKESETGLESKINYGIVATDDKGNEFKTNTLGGKMPWEDFDIACKGAEPGDEFLMVPNTIRNVENNLVKLTIKSKHHPNLMTTENIKLSYATPVKVRYVGYDCSSGSSSSQAASGNRGVSLTIYVTESTDKMLNLLEVKDGTGASLQKIKVQKGVNVIVHNYGGNGCSGSSKKSPGNGGDGGNVKIIKSPGVSSDFIQINNSGGKSGSGCCGAKSGLQGNIEENTQTVNLNF
ncbi:MAG: hypothetical protein SFY56_10620 [Bacteroidota bacterium]|nr:hypothetical protein [Bacteroidota bacterium]